MTEEGNNGNGFSSWILPLMLEPRGSTYVFNEPSVESVQKVLDAKVRPYQKLSGGRSIPTANVSMTQISSCIDNILWDVKEVGYEITDFLIKSAAYYGSGIFSIDVLVCIHKPSCAYGRVIDMSFDYNANNESLRLYMAEIIGIVPEDRIGKGPTGFSPSIMTP